MSDLLSVLGKYIHEVLGMQIKFRSWEKQSKLPIFLIDRYSFYEISLFSHRCLVMIEKEDTDLTTATVKKHQIQVQKYWKGPCIFVQKNVSAYNRKRLIEQEVAFIVPGNQMYLPTLGIDLREFYRRKPESNIQVFSPSTQAMIIYILLNGKKDSYIPTLLGKRLGYTPMTMSRVFNELESMHIGKIQRKGRIRLWKMTENKQMLWNKTEKLMRNPIKKRVWLVKFPKKRKKILAGLSALSHYSNLNPPNIPTYSLYTSEWKTWKNLDIEEIPNSEDATIELEIWQYNPILFASEGIADPISLYLSLRENRDERVESALENMMRNVKW